MKIIATFTKPEEAHLLRSHLEGSGIAAFVRDDHTVAADWALSNAVGGVKVEVAEDDYEAARAVLAEFATPPPPPDEGRPPHQFARYMKIFAVTFFVTYAVFAWQSAPAPTNILAMLMLPSIFIATCIAGIMAAFDL